ncbi:carnitine/acyl carnitine carrier [Thelephora terrestris]|uniref:Carnitine/acyl carnitine carrier n=1 Tax=Thelephora terrestris TaxID=56493 RepID=A0A9P6H4B3_9AGAM|nr:carnitine/acyl carnitine carrier [Thelephora terrestris]
MSSVNGNKDSDARLRLDPRLDFFAGTVAGMAALTVGQPFDTVKVRFQDPKTSLRYSGTFNAVSTIIREERFSGLYKGIMPPMATCALLNGLVFSSYRFLMKAQLSDDQAIPSLTQIFLAGAGTGMLGAIVTTPTELVKIRQQALLTPISTRQMLRQIIQQNGIRGLYRGITATGLRDTGYGSYFFAYEATCRYFSQPVYSHSNSDLIQSIESDLHTVPWPALLLAGGVAGVAGWITTFPFDVVKTRIQTTSASQTKKGLFHGGGVTLSKIAQIWKDEGIRVFWRGLAPTLIRAIPVNMVTFGAFEAITHALA